MVLLILSTFFLNAGLICCATYWLMQARIGPNSCIRSLRSNSFLVQDSDHRSGHVDRDSFVKNALSIVFVWEKLNYIHAVATYCLPTTLFAHFFDLASFLRLVIQLHWVLKLIGFASIGEFISFVSRLRCCHCLCDLLSLHISFPILRISLFSLGTFIFLSRRGGISPPFMITGFLPFMISH